MAGFFMRYGAVSSLTEDYGGTRCVFCRRSASHDAFSEESLLTSSSTLLFSLQLYVRRRKVIALEQQARIHRLGERVGSAIAKIKPRFGIDALAITPECLKGESSEVDVVRDNLRLDEGKK